MFAEKDEALVIFLISIAVVAVLILLYLHVVGVNLATTNFYFWGL